MGNAEPANDRRRRDRIWRRDNGSSAKAAAHGSAGTMACAIHAMASIVASTNPIASKSIGRRFRPKITPRCEQCRRINERRKKEVEYNVRIEFHRRQSRHETQSESAEHQHDRIRQPEILCATTARTPTAANNSTMISAWCMSSSRRAGVVE